MSPEIDPITLARFLSGECSPAEAATVARWVEADPAHRDQLEALRRAWGAAERSPIRWNTGRIWDRLADEMAAPAERPPLRMVASPETGRRPVPRFDRFVRGRWSWGAVAAALLLTAGAAFLLRATRHPALHTTPIPMREVATAKGQRAEVRLADGSRVILGVESRLRFPETIGTSARDVDLEGEAYFEVKHDPARPFLVRAGGTITEDLGTTFVITRYADDTATRVVVAEGRVAVRQRSAPATRSVTLSRGDLAVLGSAGVPAVSRNVALDAYVGWTRGQLQFRNSPLADVLRQLERWYAIDIQLADPTLASVSVTGTFTSRSAVVVVQAVARSLNLRTEWHGDAVRLVAR